MAPRSTTPPAAAAPKAEPKRQGLRLVPEGGLWDAEKVASFLSVSTSWVYEQHRAGRFPRGFLLLGARNMMRWAEKDVREWLAKQLEGQEG